MSLSSLQHSSKLMPSFAGVSVTVMSRLASKAFRWSRAAVISAFCNVSRTTLRCRAFCFNCAVPASATFLPLLMMAIRSQVASASERIWVEKIMVFSLPMPLIISRISAIWLGSRPEVGSSRIRISGSDIMAWANPTRWRRPLDRLPMGLAMIPDSPHSRLNSLNRESLRPGSFIPLSRAT